MAIPSTPCVKRCAIDPAAGTCAGCGRTLDEIAAWGALSEPERLAIMAGLPARREAPSPEALAGADERERAWAPWA